MLILTMVPLFDAVAQTHVPGTTRRAKVEVVTTDKDTIYGEITLPYQYKRKIWINERYIHSDNIRLYYC